VIQKAASSLFFDDYQAHRTPKPLAPGMSRWRWRSVPPRHLHLDIPGARGYTWASLIVCEGNQAPGSGSHLDGSQLIGSHLNAWYNFKGIE